MKLVNAVAKVITQAALTALAAALLASGAQAQSSQDLSLQVARGVADMQRSRLKQLRTGEWLRERLQVDAIDQRVEPPGAAGAPPTAVVRARIGVQRSRKASEPIARNEQLPLEALPQRLEVEMRFEPDTAWGQWIFVGGRYWLLDEQGGRRLELTMFPDLLLDAPLDAPHELAWAIMSP